MKKIIAIILVLTFCGVAIAESIDWAGMTDEEITSQIEKAQEELEKRGSESAPADEGMPTLQKGSKGDDVKKLQQRLKDLNYLSGSVDGDYGNGTASAVSAFQKEAGLSETGIADEATQKALYADDAPKSLTLLKGIFLY